MKQHIMFIDDDQNEMSIFLNALKQVRVEDGFKCTYAKNASHAIDMLEYLVPHFIFVDMDMPDINGVNFLWNITNKSRLKSVKKYLYTHNITSEIRNEVLSLNIDGCILKGTNEEELIKNLENAFSEFLFVAPAGRGGNQYL